MLMPEAIRWERGQNRENGKNRETVKMVERIFK